ncbi:197_t:CDS:1 [Ambispora gerdemannii]|uniref:197_t:CDS:1 n=1 Tax=Ambispora gerdemannii TaxID=144530 RepID=A0A9N8WB37_9GLOM|nr:197_t:CDS:1 [Ambispora gerdemannii]
MSKPDHGSPQKGNGGYSFSVTPAGNGNFKLAVNGNTKFKGILAYVVDPTTKLRGGEFTDLPADTKIKTCDGGDKTTISHSSASLKSLPLTFGWSSSGKTTGNMTLRAIVVVSKNKWYMVQDQSFDLASTNSITPAVTTSTDSTTSTDNSEKSQFFLIVLFTNYTLFTIIAGITTFLYILGAVLEVMLKRQQLKFRNSARNLGGFERNSINRN